MTREKRKRQRKQRRAAEIADAANFVPAEYGPLTEEDRARARARFSVLRARGYTMRLVFAGPVVEARNPEELIRATLACDGHAGDEL